MPKGGVILPILSEFRPEGVDKAIREFQKLETTTQKIGFGLQKAFLPATAALGGLFAAAIPAVKAASDLEEAQSKVGVVFGTAAKEIEAFANTAASSIGQSKQAVFDAAGVFGTFGKAAGLAGNDLATFTTDFIALASDLASFNNTTPEQAIEAIGAALRGESEPLRAYGVLLDDTTLKTKAMELGIYEGNGALTQQQKILATQAAIFEKTGDAQGDFVRTGESLANQMKAMQAEVDNLVAELGAALLPIVKELVPILRSMVGFVADNQEMFLALAGVVAVVSGAIVAANTAMKVHAGLQTVVKVANAALGKQFELSAVKASTLAKGLGLVGAAIGVGIFLYQDYNKAKQVANNRTDDFIARLREEGATVDMIAREQLDAILSTQGYQAAIEALGFSSEDLFRFLKGEAVPGMEFLVTAFGKGAGAAQYLAETLGNDDKYRKNIVAIENLTMELVGNRNSLGLAADTAVVANNRMAELGDTGQDVTRSLEEMTAAAEAISKELTTYGDRLLKSLESTRAWEQSLADAASGGAESFNDFQVDASTSLFEFREQLVQSAINASKWQDNLLIVAQQTSPEFASYLADMGVSGADLVAQLAADSDAAQDVFEAFTYNTEVMSRDVLAEFQATQAGVARRMADIRKAVEGSLPPSADMRTKAMAIGDAIYLGIVDALNAGQTNVAYAAAALADTAITSGKKAIDARSPSRVAADEIGMPIAQGVAVGIDGGASLASDSMTSMMEGATQAGVDAAKDLVRAIEDQIDSIFDAIGTRRTEERLTKRVTEADQDLAEAKRNLAIITGGAGKDSEEYAKAQREVQDATWALADAQDRHFDTQKRVADGQTKVNEALTEFGFGSPQWVEATRNLEQQNRNLEQAARTVQDREGELQIARDEAASILSGYTKDTQQYKDAVDAVEQAELRLRDANMDLLESKTDLVNQGPDGVKTFQDIAAAAGLEKTEIDKLIISYQNLGSARVNQANAEKQAAIIDQQTAQIRSSTPTPRPTPVPTPIPTRLPLTPASDRLIRASQIEAGQFSPGAIAAAGRNARVTRNIGGPVPGVINQSMPIMAHGGEYVLSADVVDAIKRGAPSRGLGRGGAAGAGGGNVINVTVTSADPQAVIQAIRQYNRTNGPAPIRVAS